MPEMVSMFNGMGGACAALISIVEFNHIYQVRTGMPDGVTLFSILIPTVINIIVADYHRHRFFCRKYDCLG